MRLLILSLLIGQAATAAGFRAAVVKVDITPTTPKWLLGYGPRQSTGVHDPIFHRIVAMDDGNTKFLLVSTDLCLFSPSVYEELQDVSRRRPAFPSCASGGASPILTRRRKWGP